MPQWRNLRIVNESPIVTPQSSMDAAPLLLASASPRRALLLRAIGVPFEAIPSEVDETPLPGEVPVGYVERLALAKAQAVARPYPGRLVLGADTTVTVDGEILGKAED